MQENKNWTALLFLSPCNVLIVVPRPVWLPWKPRGRQGYPVLVETRVVSQMSRTKEATLLERNLTVASHKKKGLCLTFSPPFSDVFESVVCSHHAMHSVTPFRRKTRRKEVHLTSVQTLQHLVRSKQHKGMI